MKKGEGVDRRMKLALRMTGGWEEGFREERF
jgi:hypothetical protein